MAKNLRLTDVVTIANGGTTSTSITMEASRVPVAILLPAAFTGTSLNFQASVDGSNFFSIYDEGTLYAPAVAASRYVGLKRVPMDGVRYLKVISTSAEAASRSITVISGE